MKNKLPPDQQAAADSMMKAMKEATPDLAATGGQAMSGTDKPDTAWLIGLRDSALALGVENGEWRWTCPDLALRFKRREDALAAVSLLDPAWRLLHPVVVQEHEWCDGQPEPEAKP